MRAFPAGCTRMASSLRHTYLTLLALSGVHPKVMQELAGHHSSKITMDIYAHVNMDAKRKAMAAVSKVF
ncbi:MAG: tyrosine-type recombinase/integrase [Coriobacteriales bacterium]|nr:tyrosine-type recombinase/integrase [Coriobacteriales bacterium]